MKRPYDAILLLGVELNALDEPTPEMHARVAEAASAYGEGVLKQGGRLIACGGVLTGHVRSEADAMAALLAERGVPRQAILREACSQDTMENMRFAARLLGGAKGKRVLVVTSDYHVLRARMTARRLGFRARTRAARLPHDAAWRLARIKEWLYTFDLIMGWQDEGRSRPKWTYRLFEKVFGAKERA